MRTTKRATRNTVAEQLHASKTHKAGLDPNCPVCTGIDDLATCTPAVRKAMQRFHERLAEMAPKPVVETDLVKCALDAVLAAFPQGATGDVMSPGLVLSKLPTGEYYASVARYPRWQGGKVVMFKAKGASWEAAVRDAMGQFLESAAVFERLREAL